MGEDKANEDSGSTESGLGPELPLVAIVGRPNVGKSTLFNKLTGSRRAIVGDEPGITRDRLYGTTEWGGLSFRIVDTGGIVPGENEVIPANILLQAQAAISEASLILLVVDARAGITPLDEQLAELARRAAKPVFVAANKVDSPRLEADAMEFERWGFDLFPVSAEHGNGVGEMLDALLRVIPARQATEPREQHRGINVAIIGRPNTGKSSLVNTLTGQERVIVSPVPGTTRDAIDTEVTQDGTTFRFIDTAGIRRKGKTELAAEKISVIMARKHLERADVAILLIDGVEGPTALDANIAGYAHEAGVSLIIAVNKWDAVARTEETTKQFEHRIREMMKFADYAPILFISAKTGHRVAKLFDVARQANDARTKRITTGELNQFYERTLAEPRATTRSRGGTRVLYITQASTRPPTFVLFTTARDPKNKLHFSYERHVENRLRQEFGFFATPIIIKQRGRKKGTS
ncbi:MAG TPA: ribosome biogenesis GTPase Der [Blastocatellia bacterium]|nr:ribosome biogenesis GTPase Der [Blastocatellia bacterium]